MNFNFDKYKLDLGEHELSADMSFEMKNETSYLEKFLKKYTDSKNYREALLPLKLQCLLNIKKRISGKYETYFDLLAGIGMSGRIFHESTSELNDFCPYCFEILERNFPGQQVKNKDMFGYLYPRADFIFSDFNNFTIKRFSELYKPVLDLVFSRSKKYVLINDCSVFYLKYGKSSYKTYERVLGLPLDGTVDDFYRKLKNYFKTQYPEWSLVAIEAFKDTSFLLFERGDSEELSIKINKKEDITFKTSLV